MEQKPIYVCICVCVCGGGRGLHVPTDLVLCVSKSCVCSRAPPHLQSEHLGCSAEFAQYQRNALKSSVTLSSLWALINTCKWARLPALSHGERGGMTVRQRQSSGQSELNLRFAHEWACHLCLQGATCWGWDKGRIEPRPAGWWTGGFVRSGPVASELVNYRVWERRQRLSVMTRLLSFYISECSNKGGIKNT